VDIAGLNNQDLDSFTPIKDIKKRYSKVKGINLINYSNYIINN
jgi:hypothetical protein